MVTGFLARFGHFCTINYKDFPVADIQTNNHPTNEPQPMKKLYYKTINLMLSNPIPTIGLGRIIGILCVFIYVLCQGCTSHQSYLEGTSTTIGVLVPWNGSIYGAEVLSHMSGTRVTVSTNNQFHVNREFSASNSYFGVVHTTESSKTQV